MGYSNLRIHRLHFPRSKLARIFPEIDTMCSTCHRGEANLDYMFWTCPALGPFWSAVFETFSYICVKEIELDPIVAVFGVASENLLLPPGQSDALVFSSLLARRLILLQWKSNKPPTHVKWVESVMAYLKLEKLKYSTQGSIKVWRPFLLYFEDRFIPNSNCKPPFFKCYVCDVMSNS